MISTFLAFSVSAELSPFQKNLKEECDREYDSFEYPSPDFEGKINVTASKENGTKVNRVNCSQIKSYGFPGSGVVEHPQPHPSYGTNIPPIFLIAGLIPLIASITVLSGKRGLRYILKHFTISLIVSITILIYYAFLKYLYRNTTYIINSLGVNIGLIFGIAATIGLFYGLRKKLFVSENLHDTLLILSIITPIILLIMIL